ncbi:MAG: hypothetical protein V1662_00150, partial [Candidatus Omnitrophota bacterium]
MKRKSLKYGIPAVFILYAVFNLFGGKLCAQPYNEAVKEAITTHYDRGRDYFCQKDYMAAKDEFEKVLALTPGHSGAQWYLSIIRKELCRQQKSFWNCLEGAKWIKGQENNREEKLESTLTTIEKELPAEKADASRQREKEKAGLVKQMEEYESQANKASEHERLAVQRIADLEQEKQHLETDIKEYKRLLASGRPRQAVESSEPEQQISPSQRNSAPKELARLQQLEKEKEELNAQLKKLRQEQEKQLKVAGMRQQADQEELSRLKKVEAEKEKLADQISRIRSEQKGQLQEKLDEYKTALRDKFDQQIIQLNQRLSEYKDKLGQMAKEKEELEKQNQNADMQNLQLSQIQKEKGRLEAELKAMQQAQQAQLDGELNKYEDTFKKYELSLRNNFEQKIDELNAKITVYENKLKKYENEQGQVQEEKNKLEEEHVDTEKQNLRLEMIEKEKEEMQAELEGLRVEQKVCVQDELKKYEQALQNTLAQKEYELEEKIKNFESKIAQPRPMESKDNSNGVEEKLLQMQAQLNEQLRSQLGTFQKEKAAPFYEQGLAYVKKKEYVLARENLEKALSVYPDYTEAKNVIDNVETLEKIDLLIAEGEHYFNEGEYQRAGEEFARVVTLDYRNVTARNYIHKIEGALKKQEQTKQELAEKEKRAREARLKAEEKRQAEEARQAQLQVAQEERAKQELAEKEKRAREARLKAEEKQQAEEERQARLKEEKERQAKQKLAEEESLREAAQRREEEQSRLAMLKLAEIKAEQEAKQKKEAQQQKVKEDIRLHLAQGKVFYCERNYEQAVKEFKDILIIDPKDAIAEKYIVNCQRAMEKQQQEALLTAQKEERAKQELAEKEKRAQEAKLKAEEKQQAEESRQAQLKAAREERAKQELAEKEKRAQEAKLKAEEKQQAEESRQAQLKVAQEERAKQELAEKEKRVREAKLKAEEKQ